MTEVNPEILRFVRYLSFKADCLREQQENPLKIDRAKAENHKDQLTKEVETKRAELREAMPKVVIEHTRPVRYRLKDGGVGKQGLKWDEKCREFGQPEGCLRFLEYQPGNPGSDIQIKSWLFELGWTPCTFKFTRNKKTGEEKQIPQVRYHSQNDPRKGELTDSIRALMEKEPALQALDGLTMAKHRLSIFENFLKFSDEGGYCPAGAGGFTNTLRFQHRNPFVNLPKADGEVPWGVEIRNCIVAPEGHIMCGSDVVSLEATTKRHFMYPYDPEYADAMGEEGFDEHLDLSVHAGALTKEEIETKGKNNPEIKSIRKQYKATNYSAVYGVGPPKLSRELFITVSKAALLLSAYWDRNWSIKKVAEDQYVKTLKDGTMWLKNPVSGFYYSLRNEKDIFSTLNQGTGVFIFDSWLMRARNKGIVIPFQYHDELVAICPPVEKENLKSKLEDAMKEVNDSLDLHVEVRVDIQFGDTYGSVH